MATIQTSMELYDRISAPLTNISHALANTVQAFENMQSAANNSFDDSSYDSITDDLQETMNAVNALSGALGNIESPDLNFDGANAEVIDLTNNVNDLENPINDNTNAQEEFNNELANGADEAGNLQSKIMGMIAAYATYQSVNKVLDLSDQMTSTEARLNLIVDDGGSVDELQDKIFTVAQTTRTSFMETSDMIAKLGLQAGNSFSSNNELLAFAEQLNKTFIIAGTHAEGVNSVMLQMTQAMAAGKLQGEELNAVLDNAQPIVANIQKYLEEVEGFSPETTANIKQLASDGVLTADIIKNAMFHAAEETNEAFEQMPLTFSQIWTNIGNSSVMAFAPVLAQLSEVANSDAFQVLVSGVIGSLVFLAGVTLEVFSLIATMGSFIADNWSLIAPIVYGVAAAVGIYGLALIGLSTYQMLSAIWTGIQTLAYGLLTAATWAEVTATLAATGATLGMNAALYASPITWVILAVIVLITVFYLAVAALNRFAGTSISATGVVAGTFTMLAAFIFNVIAYLWNMFAAIAEFFANVWSNPVYSVLRLFANMVNNVLSMGISMSEGFDGVATNLANAFIEGVNIAIGAVNWLVDALNMIPGIDLGKMGQMGGVSSITGSMKGLKSTVDDFLSVTPQDYWTAPTMEMKSLGASWDAGHEWGAGVEDSISGFDIGSIFDSNIPDPGEYMSGYDPGAGLGSGGSANPSTGTGDGLGGSVPSSAADTAANTGAIKDSVEMSTEDLKYLRDIAEAEVINRFTTAEIKVEVGGVTNNVNSNMDLDGVIDYLVTGTEEAMEKAAEGIHD